MLYQVILKSSVILSDDEFLDEFKQVYEPRGTDFEIVEARSLDGIREEVWKRPDDISDLL